MNNDGRIAFFDLEGTLTEGNLDNQMDTVGFEFEEGYLPGFYVRNGYEGRKDVYLPEDCEDIISFGNSSNDVRMVEESDKGFIVPSKNMDYDTVQTDFVGEPDEILEYLFEEGVL